MDNDERPSEQFIFPPPVAATVHSLKPAVILCDSNVGSLRIATLTLLDRLVVTLHRAGCAPIRIVCDRALPSLKRAKALGISTEVVGKMPALQEPTVITECNLLVEAADVRATIAGQGRLVDRNEATLSLGLVSTPIPDIDAALKPLPKIRATGVAGRVDDAASARTMEKALWDSLASSSDGVVDRCFNRPLGRFLSKVLIHTSVTPNQVTVVSALIGLLSAYCFAKGTYSTCIAGALLLQLSALVDCVDGEVARVAFKESSFGKWLDIGLDQVVHVAVFAAIAVGLSRQGGDATPLWLGASAVTGTLISFPVVVRGRLLAGKETDTRLERFIDAASTRDFTALLIVLAVFNKLHWFLWLTGVTVHLFWVTALLLQLPKPSKTGPCARPDV